MQQLTPFTILGIITAYFLVLIIISWYTSRKAGNESFFLADRNSSWVFVAIGMVGASLSGVTFISIPGAVGAGEGNQAFSYMQMVMGYVVGYIFIIVVLLPLYYRLGLTSIYEYLKERLGFYSYKMGAGFFLLSRIVGASFRLYLVAMVLQAFVMDAFGVPFFATVAITIILIWVYTFRGGIKTIIWTDTIQTFSMLTAVIITIFMIARVFETDISGLIAMVEQSEYSQMFFFEGGWSDPNNFYKQFFAGALIAIVMTGMDQDMMQKNLSCPNIKDAQKNMSLFVVILVAANLLFLFLGSLLYIYATSVGIVAEDSDQLYPIIALQSNLSPIVGIFFVLGLIAAAYSSADSALTSLTTSFCIDFLNFKTTDKTEAEKKRTRIFVHIGFSLLLFLVIIIFNAVSNDAVINELFTAAGFTYGPILGLFVFSLFTKMHIREVWDISATRIGKHFPKWLQRINLVVIICLLAPVLSFWINKNSEVLFYGFKLGFLIIALNGLLTFMGLWAISYKTYEVEQEAYPDE
jgi:Na+/proline symporter